MIEKGSLYLRIKPLCTLRWDLNCCESSLTSTLSPSRYSTCLCLSLTDGRLHSASNTTPVIY
uniref:Uncharacterized protein n=1 Tax=Rhizophora mucronata TaxID=61149 RepID=A0A2P2JB62_RHIMU